MFRAYLAGRLQGRGATLGKPVEEIGVSDHPIRRPEAEHSTCSPDGTEFPYGLGQRMRHRSAGKTSTVPSTAMTANTGTPSSMS